MVRIRTERGSRNQRRADTRDRPPRACEARGLTRYEGCSPRVLEASSSRQQALQQHLLHYHSSRHIGSGGGTSHPVSAVSWGHSSNGVGIHFHAVPDYVLIGKLISTRLRCTSRLFSHWATRHHLPGKPRLSVLNYRNALSSRSVNVGAPVTFTALSGSRSLGFAAR